MGRIGLTQVFPCLLPLRRRQKNYIFAHTTGEKTASNQIREQSPGFPGRGNR